MSEIDYNIKEQVKNNWALALMTRGLIIRLCIRRWRAKIKLDFNKLGLKFVDDNSLEFMKKYINLGTQNLLPPKEISKITLIETRARDNLTNYSFDTIWGRFVPMTAFDEWEYNNDKIYEEFKNFALSFVSRYDEIINIVRNDYRSMAKDVWARLYPQDQFGASESFIQNFVDEIVSNIPSKEEVLKTFKYEIIYITIPMPSVVEDNIAKAQEIKRQSEMKEFKTNLEIETHQKIADEYIKRKKELIDGFLESTVESMRHYIGDLCDNVLQSISNSSRLGNVNKHHIKRINGMIKKVKLLNFYGDETISKLLGELGEEVNKFNDQRNNDVVISKLSEIVKIGSQEFIPNFNPSISSLEI